MNKLFCLAFMLAALPALAITVEKPLDIPAQEARAQALFHEMKCVVCEGQALAESDARLAIDMRQTIRKLIGIGQSDAAIRAYFSTRYGDGVLLNPPVNASTIGLWLVPLLTLCIALGFVWWHFRKPNA